MKRCFSSSLFFFFLASGIQAWENETSSLRGGDRELAQTYDVLILGAGIAGMAAATELKRFSSISGNPSLSVKVIEGSSRVGGRAVAAGWFSGGLPGHPMAEIAQRLYGANGLDADPQNWASIKYFDSFTSPAERNNINYAFDDVYYCLQEKGLEFSQPGSTVTDRSVLDVLLQDCDWDDTKDPNAQEKYMRTWYNLQYEFGLENDKPSISGMPLSPYIDYQWKDIYIINRTYADIVRDEFAYQKIVVDTGATVKSVNYDMNPIKVTTESGVVYRAKTVIPTFSVGVLKASTSPLKLPDKNYDAMTKVASLAVYAEFRVSFPEVFFDDAAQFIAITPKSNAERGRCNYWQVLDTAWDNEFYPGSHTITCVLLTEVIEAIEKKAGKPLNPDTNLDFVSATLKTLIQESLGTVYASSVGNLDGWTFVRKPFGAEGPPRAKPPPAKTIYYTFSNHKYNPLWKGSYEYVDYVPGRTYDDLTQSFADFIAPFGGTDKKSVRLAGSGTCFRYSGWMQGAYFSGIRVVSEYLDDKYPSFSHPNSQHYCDGPPDVGRGTILTKSKQGQ